MVLFNSDESYDFGNLIPQEVATLNRNKQQGEARLAADLFLATAGCKSGCLQSFVSTHVPGNYLTDVILTVIKMQCCVSAKMKSFPPFPVKF